MVWQKACQTSAKKKEGEWFGKIMVWDNLSHCIQLDLLLHHHLMAKQLNKCNMNHQQQFVIMNLPEILEDQDTLFHHREALQNQLHLEQG
jgi:arginyl-tRNA--protein-N-Asp/Glu arginylyltransferase